MNILILNFGSSSLKAKIFEMPSQTVLWEGRFNLPVSGSGLPIPPEIKIDVIGHRWVHGGDITDPIVNLLNVSNQAYLRGLISLAPLHNPVALKGIEASLSLFPSVHQYAVLDSSFHSTIPERVYTYPMSLELRDKYKIRKYGFHGISHGYIANVLDPNKNKKIISCHLGGGSSITAIHNGKSVNTTMGFSPLSGLPGITRSGNIDPSIVSFLQRCYGYSTDQITKYLNEQSGIKSICGQTEYDRIVKSENPRDVLANDIFVQRIKEEVGSMLLSLNGCDIISFTGGIGENCVELQRAVCSSLEFLGLKLKKDYILNMDQKRISAVESKIGVWVVKANEELAMADLIWKNAIFNT